MCRRQDKGLREKLADIAIGEHRGYLKIVFGTPNRWQGRGVPAFPPVFLAP